MRRLLGRPIARGSRYRAGFGALPIIAAIVALGCSDGPAQSVEPENRGVALTTPADSIFLGRTMQLSATVTDSTVSQNARFVWSSSDTSVVVVDSAGALLAVGVGTAEVRASVQDRSAKKTVRVVLQRADGGVAFTTGSANDSRLCAIASGVVYCRGSGSAQDTTPVMVKMPGAAGLTFTAVEGSLHAACALNTDGRIMCWGSNAHWLFARSGVVVTDTGPVAVSTSLRFSGFSHGGHAQTCGISRADSVVYCWGHNDAYQLGRGFLSGQDSTPQPVGGSLRATAVSTVNFATCLLDRSGAAHCAGSLNVRRNTLGIDESTLPAETPLPVIGGLTFKSISAGDNGVCAISQSDDAYCWGANSSGQLGIGTTTPAPTGPQRVLGNLKFALLTTVYRASTCGITLEGDVYCWGAFAPTSISSRLGERALRPYPLIKGLKFKSLTRGVGPLEICGITEAGRLLCWR